MPGRQFTKESILDEYLANVLPPEGEVNPLNLIYTLTKDVYPNVWEDPALEEPIFGAPEDIADLLFPGVGQVAKAGRKGLTKAAILAFSPKMGKLERFLRGGAKGLAKKQAYMDAFENVFPAIGKFTSKMPVEIQTAKELGGSGFEKYFPWLFEAPLGGYTIPGKKTIVQGLEDIPHEALHWAHHYNPQLKSLAQKLAANVTDETKDILKRGTYSTERYADELLAGAVDKLVGTKSMASLAFDKLKDSDNLLKLVEAELQKMPTGGMPAEWTFKAGSESFKKATKATLTKQELDWDTASAEEEKLRTSIVDWLTGRREDMPKPSTLYRGIPKGKEVTEMEGYTHMTPWPSVALRRGQLIGGDYTDLLSTPYKEGTVFYRGGSLAGDPLEPTVIGGIQGRTWEDALLEAKKLYNNKVKIANKRRRGTGTKIREEDLEQKAKDVVDDFYASVFESDLYNKPGVWRDRPVTPGLEKQTPNLRTWDETYKALLEKRKRGFADEDIAELDILQRAGKLPTEGEPLKKVNKPLRTQPTATSSKLYDAYKDMIDFSASHHAVRDNLDNPYNRIRFANELRMRAERIAREDAVTSNNILKTLDKLNPKDPGTKVSLELMAERLHGFSKRKAKYLEDLLKAEFGEEDTTKIIDRVWNKVLGESIE